MSTLRTETIDCLIIGAGVHGMTLAISYMEQGGRLEELLLIDPHDKPLTNWKRQTSAIDMTHLRSTRVHHVSSNPHALKQFATRQEYGSHHFKDTFGRPSLDLFNDHAESMWRHFGLSSRFLGNEAVASIRYTDGQYLIETNKRHLVATSVIVSTGQSMSHFIPDWATTPSCRHIFSESSEETHHVTVVGGGITALHYVVARAKKGHAVTLVTKRPLEVSQFDADRSFMGPKGLNAFHALGNDWQAKRAFVVRERRPGSAPNDLMLKVKRLIRDGRIDHLIGTVERTTDGLNVNGQPLPSQEIVCCTGIRPAHPSETFLAPLLSQLDLPLTPCGTPVLNEALEWAPRLYLTGAYADLQIGPFARAVYGGQEAARRILPRLLHTKNA